MTASGAAPRRGHPNPKAGKGASNDTIRVAKAIASIPPVRPVAMAQGDPEMELQLGLPCSGRCGHCNFHPCRLHAGI